MKRLLVVVFVLAMIATGIAAPMRAEAYRTYQCEDNGFPREIGVAGSPGRVFFVGTEHSTQFEEPTIIAGARACFEINDPSSGSNIVGFDIGWGLWTTAMLSGPGLAVYLDVCGYPTETTCSRVLQPTGVDIGPGDAPNVGLTTTCLATVASICIGAPFVEYGKSGEPTLVLLVNNVPIPVNLTYNCVTLPGVPCP